MTREEAYKILNDFIENVQGTPEVHRTLWQAIETLYTPATEPAPQSIPQGN